MTASDASTNDRTFRISIKRQHEPDASPYWETFEMPYQANLNVTSVLQWIAANPTTVEGKASTPPAYEVACLEEVCGSCTMLINDHVRQSCSTLIDELIDGQENAEIALQPMTKFPVIRDLVVDRTRMFDDLKRIQAWVPIDGTHDLGPGPKEDPDKQELRYALSRCMTCGCCLEACPQYQQHNDFIGPQAIGQALLFNLHETGRELEDERLDALEGPGGITDCGNAQNCVKVCPKEVPLTEAIAKIGRQTTGHALKKFFGGR